EYIDENGGTNETKNYILLTNDINVDNLPGGWYVVQGEVKYTSQVKFSGDAHLILADGAEMEIKTEGKYGIYASKNLTIYGQNEQSGILNDTANGTNGIGIFSWSDITISGGKVTATGKNGYGIYGYDGVTISGGSVEATSTYGIYSKETVTISGGSVTASGNNSGINTNAGHITLGWTNSTDFIKVSSIHLGADSCTVSIAKGKSFVDENGNEYRGTLTDENLESIKNKTLTPLMPFPDNIVIANISGATYTGDSIRPEPVVTIGENELELGKDYTLAYKDNLNASDTAKVIVKGAGKYYGEVQKLFTIDKAPLKITALNDTIVYGDEPANQGVAYEGFVGNETSEVLKGELALEIGYKQYDDAGKYAITPSGLNADNYKIEFVAGTLTVEPKVISIVWGEQTVFAYDGKEHVPTVTAEGFVEGHVVSLVVTGAAVEVGNDTAKVALDENDANSKNYKLRASELEKEFKIVVPFDVKLLSDESIVVANIPVQNYNDGEPVCPESVILTEGKVTLKAGTDYTFACFNNTGISSATLDGAAYVEITGKGNYAGVIEKRFYIWKNLGDYAAVQIFEDENGKKHAVIDGEYEGTETVDIPNEIAVDAIEFVRDFDANTPSTVLLPFSLPSCATVNAKFYTLDNVSQSGNKWVATVASIGNALPEANTAYAVMLPTDGRLEFNFDGCSTAEKKQAIFQTGKIETSGNADGSWYFTGTYEFIHWSNPNYIEAVGDGLIYGFAGSNEKGIAKGQFGRVDYSAEINPLRCYLRKKSKNVKLQPQTLAKAAPYSISLLPETIDVKFVDKDENGEHTTAIGRMDTRTGKIRLLRTDRTYDLKGRRVNDVNRAAKGAYYGKKL
ncbi:MAG: hypothetical protein J5977_10395, partial [Fibrobacter sp.]|nr:hypothetical protein [Fibrobacter sp.]